MFKNLAHAWSDKHLFVYNLWRPLDVTEHTDGQLNQHDGVLGTETVVPQLELGCADDVCEENKFDTLLQLDTQVLTPSHQNPSQSVSIQTQPELMFTLDEAEQVQ